MLESVQNAIADAKIHGLAEMLNAPEYRKRSLVALAKGIGESEADTRALLAEHFPNFVSTNGHRSGKVFYSRPY